MDLMPRLVDGIQMTGERWQLKRQWLSSGTRGLT
jgi:hypothetical protein